MTFWELVRALFRNWPIVLVGGVLTVGSGLIAISTPGVHFTRVELIFLAPTSPPNPNALRTQSEGIIVTAGIVAKRVSGPGKVSKFASPDVTLVGLGKRDGWSLRLPDTGGQWASNFATQRLILEVVGPDDAAVRTVQGELIGRVEDELSALQDERGVAPANRISTMPAPQTTPIFAVRGARPRALALTALLGGGATIAAVLVAERWRRRRAASGTRRASSGLTTTPRSDTDTEAAGRGRHGQDHPHDATVPA